ncbi:hypothetical protein AQJ11_03200 [Streptomyces corchorusii]|uniref:Uncharacterized protein n=2 Tax=Streptomyces TaxID=1883 RepID=A0A124HPK9_STRCK|nr:hypothetical protein [Streptomyces corchorusii]KUN32548.1 hypothetical protein AQJ11_03200 [Streptomyces corchorusii]
MGTSSSIQIVGQGYAELPAVVDLGATGTGVWVNTGLQLTLPAAGTYHLDANVRSVLTASDGTNVWIGARLFDVTAGVVVPDSEVLVQQIATSVSPATTVVTQGTNQHASILVPYSVPGSRLVRLQAVKTFSGPAPSVARIQSDGSGRTTLRYERVA